MDKKKEPKPAEVSEHKQKSLECEPDDEDCEPFYGEEIEIIESKKQKQEKSSQEYSEYDDLEE